MKKSLIVLVCTVFIFGGFSLVSSYTSEQQSAYNYAYNQKITTASSIEKANMNGSLTRIAMAKMISNFSINVLGLQPDTSRNCSFSDVSSSLDAQYNYGVTQACQLGLMGIGNDGNKSDKFNPYVTVSRAQFATAFSRALSSANGKIVEDGNPYYSKHLQYLYSKGIINNTSTPSPSSVEKRGNVMIMMYRVNSLNKNVDKNENIVTVNYGIGHTKLTPGEIYYNTFYGLQIEHSGNYSRLVEAGSGDYGLYIAIYSFIPQKYGDYELSHDYDEYYINEYKNNAKNFNETGLLLHIESWSLTKKGLEDYESVIERLKDQGDSVNPTSKGYIIYQDIGMSIQDSPYVYVGKNGEDSYDTDNYRGKFWEIIGDIKLIKK